MTMKLELTQETPLVVDAKTLRCVLAVNYGEEDIPNDFPFRKGDTLDIAIDLDAGRVRDWPGAWGPAEVHMKVVDSGCYYLLDADGKHLAAREQEYVPGFFPGDHYGDYVILDIEPDGNIANWTADADDIAAAFFSA
jgi:hypothetical protein